MNIINNNKSLPLNAALILAGLTTVYIIFKAGKIYFLRRKYRHIPGPPTNGY